MINSREGSRSDFADREGSGSDEVSSSESIESSMFALELVTIAELSRYWCIKEIQEIYLEDVQQDDRGRQTQTIFEEPQIVTTEFDSVPILHDTMACQSLTG